MSDAIDFSKPEITAQKTEHIKGIAIILLMWHHLFGVEYLKDWFAFLPGIDYVIGATGNMCISIFLFCSGYGLYKSYIGKENTPKTYIFHRLVKTLIPYWIVMAVTIIYLVFAGKFELKYLPVNLLALIHSDSVLYVSFSWFIKLYVLIIFVLPLIKLIEKRFRKNALIDILIYIVVPFALAVVFAKYLNETEYVNIPSFIASTAVFLLAWFPPFASGMLFAKYNTYKKLRKFTDRFPRYLTAAISLLLLGNLFFLRFIVGNIFMETIIYECCMEDVILAPLFVVLCLLVIDNVKHHSRYVLPFLGRKSVYYWLLSGLFFLNTLELSFLITWPVYTVFILIWTFVLLTPFVFACDWIGSKLIRLICRK